jgi:hypothetical protein
MIVFMFFEILLSIYNLRIFTPDNFKSLILFAEYSCFSIDSFLSFKKRKTRESYIRDIQVSSADCINKIPFELQFEKFQELKKLLLISKHYSLLSSFLKKKIFIIQLKFENFINVLFKKSTPFKKKEIENFCSFVT